MEVAVSQRHFRAEQPVQQTQIRSLRRESYPVGKAFRERLVEVVTHFRFHHQAGTQRETGATTDAAEVGIRPRQPDIIGVRTHREMILRENARSAQGSAQKQQHTQPPHPGLLISFGLPARAPAGRCPVGRAEVALRSSKMDARWRPLVARLACRTTLNSPAPMSVLPRCRKFAIDAVGARYYGTVC